MIKSYYGRICIVLSQFGKRAFAVFPTDGDEMYEKGNMVMYGSEGACKITDITETSFNDKSGLKRYYVLAPVSNHGVKVYVPCDNEALTSKMKKILSYSEIKDILSSDKSDCEWIDDSRMRSRFF